MEFFRRRVQALRKAVVAEVADINRGIADVLRGGVLVLILTPVARVTLSLLSFLRERDRLYVEITTTVLLNLILGLLLGVA